MGKTLVKRYGSCLLLAGLLSGCLTSAPVKKNHFYVKRNWVRDLAERNGGFQRSQRMEPVLIDNLVVQGNGYDGIAAYSRNDGKPVWQFHVNEGVEGGAAADRGQLFFGGNDGFFYSVEATTGKLLWKVNVGAQVLSEPLVAADGVYFLTGNNTLMAVDRTTGVQKWQYKRAQTTNLTIRGGATPVISKSVLYVGMSDGFFISVDVTDGRLLWERPLLDRGRFIDIDSSPVLSEGRIYVSTYDGAFFCLDQKDGQVVWQLDKGGYSSATLVKDTLYHSTTTGEVIAVDAGSGQVRWTYKVKKGIPTQPTFFRGLIAFGESGGELRFLSAQTGVEVGRFNPGRGISATPLIEESGEAYIMSNEGYLYSLMIGWATDAQTGL
mgnify:FL=1